jgi:hypothetical protein
VQRADAAQARILIRASDEEEDAAGVDTVNEALLPQMWRPSALPGIRVAFS